MKKIVLLWISGAIFLIVSTPLVFQMARETFLDWLVEFNYQIKEVDHLDYFKPIYFNGQEVRITDDFMNGDYKSDETKHGEINISINGRDYSYPFQFAIYPFDHDSQRYLGSLNIRTFHDNQGTSSLVIMQNLSSKWDKGETWKEYQQSLKWRLLFVRSNGEVYEEIFSFKDRANPLYRVKLITTAHLTPILIGYKSDVFTYYPTGIYPVVYPILTFVIGIILVIADFRKLRVKTQ